MAQRTLPIFEKRIHSQQDSASSKYDFFFVHPVIRVPYLGKRGCLTVLIWQGLGLGLGKEELKLEIHANPERYRDAICSTAS